MSGRNPPPPEEPVWEADDDPEFAPMAFARYDLQALHRTGVEPPKLFCHGLLYPGGVHSLSAEPDAGKTTFALWSAVQVLREGGRVVVMDEESGPEMTSEKLAGLGVVEEELEHLHYFPFPGRSWSDPDIAALRLMTTGVKPQLVVLDSSAAFMARAGLDENSAGDVTRFYLKVVSPIARSDPHAAVLILDHDAKSDGPGGKTGRYARGNGAKLAAIDVQFKLAAVHPFSRSTSGVLTLTVTKDRRGWINPRKYRLEVTSRLDVWFKSEAEMLAAEAEDALASLTPAEEKIMSCLTANAAGVKRLTDRIVSKYEHGLRPETVSKALTKLVSLGLAEQITTGGGRGNEATWVRSDPRQPSMIPAEEVAP